MKRLTLALLMLTIGTTTMAQESSPGRIVTDPADPYAGANDLNGDGKFDVSDLIVGLDFLFNGGKPPSALVVDQLPELEALRDTVEELTARLEECESTCAVEQQRSLDRNGADHTADPDDQLEQDGDGGFIDDDSDDKQLCQ